MPGADKTEKATPKRRSEARKKGQVARSTDLNGSVVLLTALLSLSLVAPKIFTELQTSMRSTLSQLAHPEQVVTAAGLEHLMLEAMRTVALTVGPIAGICMVSGIVINLAQVKFKPSLQALKPDPGRINPLKGFKNVFGPQLVVEALKNCAKVAVVAVVAAVAVVPKLTEFGAMVGISPGALTSVLGHTVIGIAQRTVFAYLIIAFADLAWQRYRHEKQLKMTKEEVKEEHKQMDLPQEVKSALRRRQMQAARARMMADVPLADVVVTNPTHFAVALKYDGKNPAPEVVAKGQDLVALQIRKLAEDHDVPVVSDPPLARSLHRTVEVGHQIPEELFQAVAQLLAFVYRVAGRRRRATA